MLRNFIARGIPVLGIDPAKGPAQAAQKAGIPTMCTFFSEGLARQLREKGWSADVVLANSIGSIEVNVVGTFNVIEACIKNGIERIVYSSSASVYGDAFFHTDDRGPSF